MNGAERNANDSRQLAGVHAFLEGLVMKTLNALSIVSIVAALTVASTPAAAQSCLGLPIVGKNYIGAEQRESWTGYRRQTPTYGGRFAHNFDAGRGIGVTASIGGGGGRIEGDTTAIHVSGMLSTGTHVAQSNLSVCASAGFDAQAVDYPGESKKDADAFGSIPVSLGFGYDVHVSALTLTPFVAPTLAYYMYESDGFKNRAKQRGFDKYVVMGATAAVSRFSVGANYRNGDKSLGESGRFSFSTGVSF